MYKLGKCQKKVLITLNSLGKARLSEISKKSSINKSNCSRALISLARKGLVGRNMNKDWDITILGIKYVTTHQMPIKKGDFIKNYFLGKNKTGRPYIVEDGSKKLLHRHIMEVNLGRKLMYDEVVHHIDGNKLNNNINNLFLCSGIEHCKIHGSLNKMLRQLYELKYIGFDKEKGKYFVISK